MKYCFDTGAYIRAWRETYPPDVFKEFWKTFEDFLGSGAVISPQVVLDELKKKDDDLYKWARKHPGVFQVLGEDVQRSTSEILAQFPRIMEEGRDRNTADPFVIATARVHGLTVVTTERFGNEKKPKIPFVCQHFGIKAIGLVAFLREQKWKF